MAKVNQNVSVMFTDKTRKTARSWLSSKKQITGTVRAPWQFKSSLLAIHVCWIALSQWQPASCGRHSSVLFDMPGINPEVRSATIPSEQCHKLRSVYFVWQYQSALYVSWIRTSPSTGKSLADGSAKTAHELINRDILIWFCRDLIAFEAVEKGGFVAFFQKKNFPTCQIPTAEITCYV